MSDHHSAHSPSVGALAEAAPSVAPADASVAPSLADVHAGGSEPGPAADVSLAHPVAAGDTAPSAATISASSAAAVDGADVHAPSTGSNQTAEPMPASASLVPAPAGESAAAIAVGTVSAATSDDSTSATTAAAGAATASGGGAGASASASAAAAINPTAAQKPFSFKPMVPPKPDPPFPDVEHMSLPERRRYYHCGRNFTALASIPDWLAAFTVGLPEIAPDPYPVRLPMGMTLEQWEAKQARIYSIPPCATPPPHRADLNQLVRLWHGDITRLEVDAIVNAANQSLMGGGGVDGAIHSAAGYEYLQYEEYALGGAAPGQVKKTRAYRLPALAILHAVGPVVPDQVQPVHEQLLAACYTNALNAAKQHGYRTIAFPAISSGIFGYPYGAAAAVAAATVRRWLEDDSNRDAVDAIIFTTYPNQRDNLCYRDVLSLYFPGTVPGSKPPLIPPAPTRRCTLL